MWKEVPTNTRKTNCLCCKRSDEKKTGLVSPAKQVGKCSMVL